MMFPNVELFLLFVPVPIKAKYFIPALIVLDLFSENRYLKNTESTYSIEYAISRYVKKNKL